MPKQALEIKDDEQALVAVCGSEEMAEKVKALWEDIKEKKKLDVHGQGLTDESVGKMLKGLHMCAPRPVRRSTRRFSRSSRRTASRTSRRRSPSRPLLCTRRRLLRGDDFCVRVDSTDAIR